MSTERPTDNTPVRNLPPSPFRGLLDRAFTVVAFTATFFGLAMLVVFFWRLGVDAHNWFVNTPQLVQQRNEELAEQAAKARQAEAFIAEKMKQVDLEMEAELKAAKTDQEKAEIRKDYEKIKLGERDNIKRNIGDFVGDEKGIRPDTGPVALLAYFYTAGPSNEPQDAGILPALLGSIWVGIITVIFAVPLGVGAAVYLEEYKESNWLPRQISIWLARVIQVNISNLAGVPSVMYGILGAFVFVELIFKPMESGTIAARNVLGGGLTLALLTLPVVIVSAQEAIRAVPVSYRHAAYALGATRWQVIWHHVLPNALPGILTGTILSLSRALGEAAPLVLFGALLFVNQNPSLFSRFTVVPMQIFGWTDRPVEAWRNNAGLASLTLVLTLLFLNGSAIYLRQRAQRRIGRN